MTLASSVLFTDVTIASGGQLAAGANDFTVNAGFANAGTFTHDADRLSFGPIASTKRACLPPFDRLEADLIAALERTASYAIAGDTLQLIDADGADLARLEAVYLY